MLCCTFVSKSLSKPKGANDRYSSEILEKTNDWLKKEIENGNPNIVVHTDYQWPEVNPVELKVPDVKGKDLYLQIQNYRYPSAYDKDHAEYRGAIFFVHGFVEHSGHHAHHGEIYSKLGYDFYAMDVRGHGKSEG